MQFNSYEFILIFLPLLLAGYFLLNRLSHTLGKVFLAGMGAAFYLYYGVPSAVLLLFSLLFNYAAAALVARRDGAARTILILDVAANLALLFFFKYADFFLETLESLLRSGYRLNLFLPLGISFFTFQQISYVLHVRDSGRNETVLNYLLYILFFPKLIMGPLAEPDELIPQFDDASRKKPVPENLACGAKLFCFGLFKKMILADTFFAAVEWGFAEISGATSGDLFLTMLAYTFEIYFDFSGYSDMAVGIAQMLNIDLPINFDSPYRALSIRDFWKRWHISLTAFLTRHVYYPLGGNRRGTARQYLNIMVVFLLSGIWHGANWTFFLWGLLHGALSVFERMRERAGRRLNDVAGWLFTFLSVNVLWLLFRAESVFQWLGMLKGMLRFGSTAISEGLLECFEIPEARVLLPALRLSPIRGASALLFYLSALLLCLIPENNYRRKDSLTPAGAVLAALAFFFGFLHLGGESVFVYFNF